MRNLLQRQVDGFLLVPSESSVGALSLIHKQGVPVVVLDRKVPYAVDTVRSDSVTGASQLTRLLLELGHRRIAILTGPREVSTAADRVKGYQLAMRDAEMAVDERLVCYGAFSQEGGYEMSQTILGNSPRPTAIFAGNNFIAVGVLRAFREAGLQVPDDLALVAFDDLPPTYVVDPFLTVAAQSAYEMGRKATQLLMQRMGGTAPEVYQEILLPTRLIIRQSSGRPLDDVEMQ